MPVEDTWGAMAELAEAGKVRYRGSRRRRRRRCGGPHAVHPISAGQYEWSLFTRDLEDEVLATLRELGAGVVAYSPLGRGFLSGRITSPDDLGEDDFRRNHPRFSGENFARNLDLVERVNQLAAGKGATPSQLAIAWVLAQGDDVVPIPGTKRRSYLEENAGALEVELTPEDLAAIEEVTPRGRPPGSATAPSRWPTSTPDSGPAGRSAGVRRRVAHGLPGWRVGRDRLGAGSGHGQAGDQSRVSEAASRGPATRVTPSPRQVRSFCLERGSAHHTPPPPAQAGGSIDETAPMNTTQPLRRTLPQLLLLAALVLARSPAAPPAPGRVAPGRAAPAPRGPPRPGRPRARGSRRGAGHGEHRRRRCGAGWR